MNLRKKVSKVSAPIAQFLLRVPVSILFLQQGFSKLPITNENPYGLPSIVWWFVTFGEIGVGIGIIVGGVIGFKYFISVGDLITRFSGVTMACIITGVIWISYPPDLMTVLLYDYLHVSLYFIGVYFALAGNAKWSS
tara:strand:+ start:80 stop:490 length:411 start_codon:yes stop_codon:yes gene_type:complete